MPEIYVVVALAFAVFAAVSAIGSAIVLGIGYERLRAGLERVKEGLDLVGRQTGFFSTELYKLDQKVEEMAMENSKPKVRAKKASAKSRTRAKKTMLPEVAQDIVPQEKGSISVPMGLTPSNDWQMLQTLSREEALASFAQMGASGTDGKIRYM
ncbi:MAG: hypothetical protein PHX61_01265 [Alphaproteobacteria bacterium]|nr:hypothetical protein [Alphaproteobacteria bacterium]OIN87934.1 MAG: hypothetical protein AUJ12_00200 [Alphaproteobacteria bacterium CG1_02_46_17]